LSQGFIMTKRLVVFISACVFLLASTAYAGNVESGQAKASTCAGCHGQDGNSVNPQWPKLAGQHPKYIYKQLQDFKRGARVNPIMSRQAADLTEADMRDLAAYFSAQTTSPGTANEEGLGLGEQVYRGGVPGRSVPACMACHGPAGFGNPAAVFPRLAYQHAPYVADELRDYRAGTRANDPSAVMRTIARRMTTQEIEAVAQYVSGLHRAEGALVSAQAQSVRSRH
jgi:cytochrome c553